jgi:hypothetical protein
LHDVPKQRLFPEDRNQEFIRKVGVERIVVVVGELDHLAEFSADSHVALPIAGLVMSSQ